VLDASFFKTAFLEHLKAAGAKSTVELHLLNAHTHRVRTVLDANVAFVALEAYRQRIDGGRSEQYWEAKPLSDDATVDIVRIIVPYETIAEIVITPAEDSVAPRIGFVRD
jgi:hypothetical protein